MVDQLYSLLPTFPDLYMALLVFLTLPITMATAESLFSKLKLIKAYLRNTMQQDRLSGTGDFVDRKRSSAGTGHEQNY